MAAEEVDLESWETTNLLTISTALADAAALREETRGSHWREDFPERDDERFAGHFDVVMRDGETELVFVPSPADGHAVSALVSAVARRARRGPGLDPAEVQAAIDRRARRGPARREDVTSVATIAADARGRGRLRGPRARHRRRARRRRPWSSTTVMGDDVEVTDRVPDGTRVAAGDVVMRVAGPTRGLLTAERTALNFACHLSGVATATAAWVDALEGTGARVLDTRKTLPGWRALQKYAVRCGGGVNHRISLSDRAMVKDNHVVAAGGVVPAYEAVRAALPRTCASRSR